MLLSVRLSSPADVIGSISAGPPSFSPAIPLFGFFGLLSHAPIGSILTFLLLFVIPVFLRQKWESNQLANKMSPLSGFLFYLFYC